jgi:uracil-DNA glycosylase family 4
MAGELDPTSELRFLTEALRAHAEWQQACGALALPRGEGVEGSRGRGVEAEQAPPVAARAAPAPIAAATPVAVALQEALPTPPLGPSAPPPLLTTPERHQRLTVLAETVRGCTRCVLHSERKQTVFARGNGSSGLCFIGEGPGADEDAQGFPFVGAAGQLLDRMIAAMGIERDDVYVCNIVKCRPPKNRTPEPEEMNACMPYLTEQLSLVEPQVIVALGKTAVQGLFGTAEGITRIRGRWRLYQQRIAVMPTFHPAYLLRNPAAKREVWADLQLVLKHMGRSVPGK